MPYHHCHYYVIGCYVNGQKHKRKLWWTKHLSVPDIALSPPQLPLMFLPINITPNDIIVTMIVRQTNVNKNSSIFNFYIKILYNL